MQESTRCKNYCVEIISRHLKKHCSRVVRKKWTTSHEAEKLCSVSIQSSNSQMFQKRSQIYHCKLLLQRTRIKQLL